MLLLPVYIAALSGAGLLVLSLMEHLKKQKSDGEQTVEEQSKQIHIYTAVFLLAAVGTAMYAAMGNTQYTWFTLMDQLPVYFRVDEISRLFVTVTSIVWTAVCFYSFKYMKHEGDEKRFYGFFLLLYGVLVALDFSGNLVTMYFFYELMTLTSMPLVLHNGSKEAIMAALKYLFYSMAGAYMALFGIFVLYQNCTSLTFQVGGTLNGLVAGGNHEILLVAVFLMLTGFGAKAGMFPLHAWLPTAHPVAPAPASAALSAIIVKGGVLAIIRTVYYIVGPYFLRGTWVQEAWLVLSLATVLMGSMLAYREKVFKKRLAYSTVSQVSYILFGLALFTPQGVTGALLQFVAHAIVKCALFMTAGIFILRTGKTRVEEYNGIGRTMGKTLLGYTLAALSLIGIPPTAGFISKWYLAQGSLDAGLGVISYAGPVVLLLSALLTAGYLLPITMNGFFPGKEDVTVKEKEKVDMMTLVLLILGILAVVIGLMPGGLLQEIGNIAVRLCQMGSSIPDMPLI